MRITLASSGTATIGKQLLTLSSYPPLLSRKLDGAVSICYLAWFGSLICRDLIRKYNSTVASSKISKIMSNKYYTLLPIVFLIILFVKQELEMEFFHTSDKLYQSINYGSKIATVDDVQIHHITNMCQEGQSKEFDSVHVGNIHSLTYLLIHLFTHLLLI